MKKSLPKSTLDSSFFVPTASSLISMEKLQSLLLQHQAAAAIKNDEYAKALFCYEKSLEADPENFLGLNDLGLFWQRTGKHGEANKAFLQAIKGVEVPTKYLVISNYLLGLQYQHQASLEKLRQLTVKMVQDFPKPQALPLKVHKNSPEIKIGFVSADLCEHPVGFHLLPLLEALNCQRFKPVLYSNEQRDDAVSRALKKIAIWRDIDGLDYEGIYQQIQEDSIDILVDLSGHTAKNCLAVFAKRAAPIQVSWLGYFATTGLPAMDYVFMDKWHVPTGSEQQFTEKVVLLPYSKFIIKPMQDAPEVGPSPYLRNGYLTFASFNVMAKMNKQVREVWAEILKMVPESKLLLKNKLFNESTLCQEYVDYFKKLGIAPERLILRGSSSLLDVYKQYNEDVDICLDPFPFTGGQTSCEALWMGIPVITWAGAKAVERQTLSLIGNLNRSDCLAEWVASDAKDYLQKAVALARQPEKLQAIRKNLRLIMRLSPLTNAQAFARGFENAILSLLPEEGPSAS